MIFLLNLKKLGFFVTKNLLCFVVYSEGTNTEERRSFCENLLSDF